MKDSGAAGSGRWWCRAGFGLLRRLSVADRTPPCGLAADGEEQVVQSVTGVGMPLQVCFSLASNHRWWCLRVSFTSLEALWVCSRSLYAPKETLDSGILD